MDIFKYINVLVHLYIILFLDYGIIGIFYELLTLFSFMFTSF